MNEVTIHRGTPHENFTVLRNEIFEHEELSLEALGLLTYLISRPRDWKVNQSHLKKRFGFGRDKFQRVMRELILVGYVERRQGRSDDESTFGAVQYHVFDTPIKACETQDTLQPENPVADENKAELDGNEEEICTSEDQQPENLVTRSSGDLKIRTLTNKDNITNNTPLPPKGARRGAALAGDGLGSDWDRFCKSWILAPGDSFERAKRAWRKLDVFEQSKAVTFAERYQSAAKGNSRKTAARTYLRQHLWEGFERSNVGLAGRKQVFVLQGSPAWDVWRNYRGKAIPTGHHPETGKPGWWFDSLFPPGHNEDQSKAS
nr:hypothetical protein [uncultured Cohaesibacter sp.]